MWAAVERHAVQGDAPFYYSLLLGPEESIQVYWEESPLLGRKSLSVKLQDQMNPFRTHFHGLKNYNQDVQCIIMYYTPTAVCVADAAISTAG